MLHHRATTFYLHWTELAQTPLGSGTGKETEELPLHLKLLPGSDACDFHF